jgi:hypothetical protein
MCQLLLTPCIDHFSANVFEESQNIPSLSRVIAYAVGAEAVAMLLLVAVLTLLVVSW